MRHGMWLYPWDLFDHGPGDVVRELHAMGVDDVFLALSYHSVRVLLPDNPRRRVFDAPHAALYVEPDPAVWADLDVIPAVASLVAENGDAAQAARAAISDRPLRLAAWAVCLHDSTLARRQPAATLVDAWGERSQRSMCLANPWTRSYARALVRQVSACVDAVQLEAAHWMPPHAVHAKLDAGQPHVYSRLTTMCVCDCCLERVAGQGADPERLRAQLARLAAAAVDEPSAGVVPPGGVDAHLAETVDDFAAFQQCRTDSVTSLVAELAQAAGGKPVEFVSYGERRIGGIDLSAIVNLGVSVRVLAYGTAPTVQRCLDDLRASPDAPARFGVGLSALPSDAPNENALRSAYESALGPGIESVAYYNFGMLTTARRQWLKTLLRGSGS